MRFPTLPAAVTLLGSLVLGSACAVPAGQAESGAAAVTEAKDEAGGACDPAQTKQRLHDTYARTAQCAATALSAGLADKVHLAGDTVRDTKKIVDAIKAVAGKVVVTNVSTARASLCVRSVTDYITAETARDAIVAGANGLSPEELNSVADEVLASFTFYSSTVWSSFDELNKNPSAENLSAFLIALAYNVSSVGEFVTACAPVLAPYGIVALPAVTGWAERFGSLGTIGAIADCSVTLAKNTEALYTELACLAKDLETLRNQNEKISRTEAAGCENFQALVDEKEFLVPLIQDSANTSDERHDACERVISTWGACLYNARTNGWFKQRALSCDECRVACDGTINTAAPHAYLDPGVRAAARASGADENTVLMIANQAASDCGANLSPDGTKPCIDACRQLEADCN